MLTAAIDLARRFFRRTATASPPTLLFRYYTSDGSVWLVDHTGPMFRVLREKEPHAGRTDFPYGWIGPVAIRQDGEHRLVITPRPGGALASRYATEPVARVERAA